MVSRGFARTRDWSSRARLSRWTQPCSSPSQGEVILNERALGNGTQFTGVRPSAALLVENLGPYMDVPAPDDWMVIHAPGWNTVTAMRILDLLDGAPILHFGDLDPQESKS